GAEGRHDVAVILAALIGVADQQRDRRAGGPALVDTGQDLHFVRFVSLRGVTAAAGGAPFQVVAELLRGDLQPGRAAVDHAADRRPVAFAEGGDGKEFAERVAGHGVWTSTE